MQILQSDVLMTDRDGLKPQPLKIILMILLISRNGQSGRVGQSGQGSLVWSGLVGNI